MSRLIALATITSSLAVAACSQAAEDESVQETSVETAAPTVATAELASPDGTSLGTADLSEGDDGLILSVDVHDISEGAHGFHLHTTGDCSATDFTSAGGHLNPLGKSHGSDNPAGKHLGDLPNLDVGANGTASASLALDGAVEDVLAYLFDEDGTAIVVHEGADDYMSDPAGAAGPRIACGVLSRS